MISSQNKFLLTCIFTLNVFAVASSAVRVNDEDGNLSFSQFKQLLYSEVHHTISGATYDTRRRLQEQGHEEDKKLWKEMIRHGWDLSKSLDENFHKQSKSRRVSTHQQQQQQQQQEHHGENDASSVQQMYGQTSYSPNALTGRTNATALSPYLVCSHSSKPKSAFQRIQPMLNRTESHLQDYVIVRNDPHRTCFHVTMKHDKATALQNVKELEEGYSIVPMVDLMKVQMDTFTSISNSAWTVPPKKSSRKVKIDNHWERVISVAFSVGHRKHQDGASAKDMATSIINDIRSFAETDSQQNRNQRRRRHLTKKEHAMKKTSDVFHSLSQVFSMTKDSKPRHHFHSNTKRKLRDRGNPQSSPTTHHDDQHGNYNQWSRSLNLGLEADHGCQAMFEHLHINIHHDNEGFDIVLNPSVIEKSHKQNDGIEIQQEEMTQFKKEISDNHEDERLPTEVQCKQGIELCSSASNKHCVISLVMGLATHPMVMSIESNDGPVASNDYESQWITQSKVLGSRPLRNIGINGENQIISIADSGLDVNHKYFGPTSSRIYYTWDYTQRKVVRYDHSLGDAIELRGGHGTKVAGVAAGQAFDDVNDKANGIAQAAKLHIFDIQTRSGAYNMNSALPFRLFQSMHSTNGNPARVAVGSFDTKYRPYSFTCKFFDEALYGTYKGDLYVASAGNNGLDVAMKRSRIRTIGNPAACKNTLAVGASQSDGVRISTAQQGKDYLAAFSSRGPTYDCRMKPDLVAPGASVLTPKAHENASTVQSYGTSFAAPTVAGNAALVRQYFEEGHLPCDELGNEEEHSCRIDPSGSLVKAVLMNSARSLKQVQVSRPWIGSQELEEVSEYDNSQGMGLIQLDNTLPIANHNKINAIVRNNQYIKDGEFHDIFIRATPHKCLGKSYIRDFSATLAWYDAPGSANCAKCLINDLDIMVHEVRADRTIKKGTKKFPNGLSRKDYNNNVERLRFTMSGMNRYRIRIYASNLDKAQTQFSMIASGCFKVISAQSHQG